jgi:hypothetical protein
VDFGELNDKTIKGLMNLSKIVSKFYLYIHEQPLKYLNVDEYYGSHWQKQVYDARLHVFIGRDHNNKCTHYGSKLEACTFVGNQDQAFEAVFFQMKVNYVWSKVELKVDWISDEEINRDV